MICSSFAQWVSKVVNKRTGHLLITKQSAAILFGSKIDDHQWNRGTGLRVVLLLLKLLHLIHTFGHAVPSGPITAVFLASFPLFVTTKHIIHPVSSFLNTYCAVLCVFKCPKFSCWTALFALLRFLRFKLFDLLELIIIVVVLGTQVIIIHRDSIIIVWGADKINCMYPVWNPIDVVLFWGGPYRFTLFGFTTSKPSTSFTVAYDLWNPQCLVQWKNVKSIS